jgi:hypothetical protein
MARQYTRSVMSVRALLNLPLLIALLLLVSCGDDGDAGNGEPTPGGDGNEFENGSFEEGREPWFALINDSDDNAWVKDFTVSQTQAHSGTSSAFVELDSADEGPLAARRYGVVQEVVPDEFPEVITGCYYVEAWEQGTPRQYAQVAVIVFEPENVPPDVLIAANNIQMRYVLFGVESPPIRVDNAKFVMTGRGEPVTGEWVCFELDLRNDFQELWGLVPEGYQKVRVLFEVNWDERDASDPPAIGDVYYDDLYIGPG